MNNQEKLLLNKQKYENKIFETSKYGKVEVLMYKNKKEVIIKFINTGNVTTVTLNNLINDRVKDGYAKTICGVGFLGDMKNPYTENRRLYDIWSSMLQRCYDEKLHIVRPTYKGCSVSEDFKSFTNFLAWVERQVGSNSVDSKGLNFHLDKDILRKGNKVYSAESCCFVPHDINTQFTMSKAKRGELPVGVSKRKGSEMYRAQIKSDGVVRSLGDHPTIEQAFQAYKQAKEAYIKEVANKWRDQIDDRVYEALMNYEVEITD